MEKKSSYYVLLHITEVVEVTQEINSTGIIPLEALRAYLPKKPYKGQTVTENILSHVTKNFHNLYFCIKQCEFVFDKATQFHVKRRDMQVVAEIVSVVV